MNSTIQTKQMIIVIFVMREDDKRDTGKKSEDMEMFS